jgi:hypothetical protein
MTRISIFGFSEVCIGAATFLFYTDSDYAAASLMCFGFFIALMNAASKIQASKTNEIKE